MKNIIAIFLQLIIAFMCFTTTQAQIDSSNIEIDSLLNIRISKEINVSSASKYAQSVIESPLSASLISKEKIQEYNYMNLEEALSSQPDLFLATDLTFGYLGIRGFGVPGDYNRRVIAVLDGHILNERYYGSVSLFENNLSPFMFESIEVIKGPGSLTYGTSAMFGIIGLNTINLESSPIPKISVTMGNPERYDVNIQYSYDFFKDFNFQLFTNYSNVDGGNVYFPEFDSPETNNGIAENINGDEIFLIYNKMKYKDLTFSGFFSARNKNIPTAPYETVFNEPIEYYEAKGFLDIKNVFNLSFDKILIPRIYYDYYSYSSYYPYEDDYYTKDHNVVELLGAEIQYLWDIMPNYRLTSGIEYRHSLNAKYRGWDEEETFISVNQRNDEFSIYILNEYNPFDFVSIYAGLRYDNYFNIDSRVSPRISLLLYPFKNHTIKYVYGESFRTPNVDEKYYFDLITNFKISKDLQSEVIVTNELIYEQMLNTNTKLTLSIYHNNVKGLISVTTDPDDNMDQYKNIDNFNGLGGSIDVNSKLNNSVSLYSNYSYQKISADKVDYLINSPAHLLKFGMSWHLFTNFSTSMEYRYESLRKTFDWSETPEIHYINLNLIYNPFEDFRIAFSVRNLLNSVIMSPVGTEHSFAVVPNPGRGFYLRFGWGL